MPINCICPQCRKTLSISEEFAGQPMRCPLCSAMFQAPALPPVLAGKASSAPSSPPVSNQPPPWERAGSDARAPEWPWLVGPKPPPSAGPGYDWTAVKPMVAEAIRLAPGWHMVRRGLTLLPGSLILVFTLLAFGRLFFLIAQPGPETTKVLGLIVIPVALLGSLAALAGEGMCCLVPQETRVRPIVIGAVLCLFLAALAGMLAVFIFMITGPGAGTTGNFWTDFMAAFAKVIWGGAAILVLAGESLFLLFMRGVATVFGNKRLAQHVLYFLIFFACSPVVTGFAYFLFSGTALLLGLTGDSGAVSIILNVVLFIVLAIVLTGFLLLVRDVRSTIERAILPAKA